MLAFSFGHRDLPREHASQLSSGSVCEVILSRTETRSTPTYPTWRGLELRSVTLTPDATGGVFEVHVDLERVWSRKEQGRFPEIRKLKQLVRDRIAQVARSDIPTPADPIRLEP
jgi:selenoprotein W-related protein